MDYENPPRESNDRHATTTGSTFPAKPSPAPARRVELVSHLEGNSVSPGATIPPERLSWMHGKAIAEYAATQDVGIKC